MATTMTWTDKIKHLADGNADEVSGQWLADSEQAAPYCVLPALLFLKENGVNGNENVLEKLAISFPDRQALALLLSQDADFLTAFYPSTNKSQTPDTVTTIDRFLENYGKSSPSEVEAISRAIFNPQPDYADVLAAQRQSPAPLASRRRPKLPMKPSTILLKLMTPCSAKVWLKCILPDTNIHRLLK